MHVSRKPGVYGQIELKTRIHKRRHKLSQWNCSLLKNQNFSIFPPLLTISEVKSRSQKQLKAEELIRLIRCSFPLPLNSYTLNQLCENAQKSPISASHVFTFKVLPYLGSRLTTSISPVQLLLLIPFSTQLKIIAELVVLELRIKFILLALIQTAYSYGECDSVRWTGLASGVFNAIILSYKEEEIPQ